MWLSVILIIIAFITQVSLIIYFNFQQRMKFKEMENHKQDSKNAKKYLNDFQA